MPFKVPVSWWSFHCPKVWQTPCRWRRCTKCAIASVTFSACHSCLLGRLWLHRMQRMHLKSLWGLLLSMCRSGLLESVKLNVLTTKHGSRIRWFRDAIFFSCFVAGLLREVVIVLPIFEGQAAVLFVRDGKTPRGACRQRKWYSSCENWQCNTSRILGADSMDSVIRIKIQYIQDTARVEIQQVTLSLLQSGGQKPCYLGLA